MGLLRFLGFGGGGDPDAEAGGEAAPGADDAVEPADNSWGARLGKHRELERPQAVALIGEFLTEIGDAYGGGKIVAPDGDDGDDMELRAVSEGAAFRVRIDVDSGWLFADMKIENRLGPLDLTRDHDKVPRDKAQDDDPWSDDDEVRVFVEKGIFVEGYDDDVNETLGTLELLPPMNATHTYAEMERLRISWLRAGDDEVGVGFDPNIDDLSDPAATVHAAVSTLALIGAALGSGDGEVISRPKVIIRGAVEVNGQMMEPNVPTAARVERVSCAFCSSLYVAHGQQPRCPNCGAPLGQ